MSVVRWLRVILFYVLFALSAIIWFSIGVLISPALTFPQRYRFICTWWCNFVMWLCKVVLNIDYTVTGLENIPSERCVILAKHQSTWETFYFCYLFAPVSQVLKKELTYIPFAGWALSVLKPIAIDRAHPKQALKQVAKLGAERLADNNWVLIFPEGTRVPPGKLGKFSRGGASLAVNAGLPVLPIAHNAGSFWPRSGWSKKPGMIDVRIGPLMYPQGQGSEASAELTQRAYLWIAQAQYDMGDLDEESARALNLQLKSDQAADSADYVEAQQA